MYIFTFMAVYIILAFGPRTLASQISIRSRIYVKFISEKGGAHSHGAWNCGPVDLVQSA